MSKSTQRKMSIRQDGYRTAQVGRSRNLCPHTDAADRWRWLAGFDNGILDLRKRTVLKKRMWRQKESRVALLWRLWYRGLYAFGVL